MASELVVPVVKIKKVRKHPNADKLEICSALGYQCLIKKGSHKDGDLLVYFPPDTLIPAEVSESHNIRPYLKGPEQDRVGSIRLRGTVSHGLLLPLEDMTWKEGDNVADHYGCKKYMPPVKNPAGDTATPMVNIDAISIAEFLAR